MELAQPGGPGGGRGDAVGVGGCGHGAGEEEAGGVGEMDGWVEWEGGGEGGGRGGGGVAEDRVSVG